MEQRLINELSHHVGRLTTENISLRLQLGDLARELEAQRRELERLRDERGGDDGA